MIPAVTGLMLCGLPIIKGLFVYGAFTVSDAKMAAMALAAYGCGLPGFVMVKILQTAFYATGQSNVVLKISLITISINVAGSLSLMPILGHVGLALATAVSGTAAAMIMLFLLSQQHRLSASFLPVCGKIMLASAVMGAAIIGLQFCVDKFVTVSAAVGLAVIVGGGGAVYAVTAYIMGAVPEGLTSQSYNRNT